MSKDFEQDELLVALKKSAKEQEAPMIDDRIILSATMSDSVKGPRRWFTNRSLLNVIGGAAAFAVIAGVTFSMNAHSSNPNILSSNTAPSKDSGVIGNEINSKLPSTNGIFSPLLFKLGSPSNDSAPNALRIWVPDVVATAGPNLSAESDWKPLIYDAFQTYGPETLIQKLADYFGVSGAVTKVDTSHVWVEDRPSKQSDILEIRDKKTGFVLQVDDNATGSFSLENYTSSQDASGPINTKVEAQGKLQEIINAINHEVYPEDFGITYGEISVVEETGTLVACANQVVDGHEVPIQLCATFVNGELNRVSGTTSQFGTSPWPVSTESEKNAVSRLGSYFDNPYRVTALGDPGSTLFGGSKLDSYLDYCENNPSPGIDCVTTVDKVVRGYGVTYDKNGVLWVVPSYSMYHNGFFIGSVNALSSEYLNQ